MSKKTVFKTKGRNADFVIYCDGKWVTNGDIMILAKEAETDNDILNGKIKKGEKFAYHSVSKSWSSEVPDCERVVPKARKFEYLETAIKYEHHMNMEARVLIHDGDEFSKTFINERYFQMLKESGACEYWTSKLGGICAISVLNRYDELIGLVMPIEVRDRGGADYINPPKD